MEGGGTNQAAAQTTAKYGGRWCFRAGRSSRSIPLPAAPYERASLVASYSQRHKPRSKILVLDAKSTFTGQDLFQNAWQRHYPGMIEWLPAEFAGGGNGGQ